MGMDMEVGNGIVCSMKVGVLRSRRAWQGKK